ncbi:MAG: hypothetical protein CL926_11580 [Deltaproteobacteria bacterium]|nr:hypothetical protein [Deltaproteobacteria bacterium]
MRILVTCPKNSYGFSLTELLVVLVILGLISSFVLQNFGNTLDAAKRWTQKEEVFQKIDRLGYISRESFIFIDEDSFKDGGEMANYLPADWKILGDFKFFPNGSCSGGRLELFFKMDLIQQDTLQPPLCNLNDSE